MILVLVGVERSIRNATGEIRLRRVLRIECEVRSSFEGGLVVLKLVKKDPRPDSIVHYAGSLLDGILQFLGQ